MFLQVCTRVNGRGKLFQRCWVYFYCILQMFSDMFPDLPHSALPHIYYYVFQMCFKDMATSLRRPTGAGSLPSSTPSSGCPSSSCGPARWAPSWLRPSSSSTQTFAALSAGLDEGGGLLPRSPIPVFDDILKIINRTLR